MTAVEELRRLREKTEQLCEELKEFQKHEYEEYLRYVEEGNKMALNRALGQSWGFETAHDLVKNYLRFDEMKKPTDNCNYQSAGGKESLRPSASILSENGGLHKWHIQIAT